MNYLVKDFGRRGSLNETRHNQGSKQSGGIILASLRLGARHYGVENKLINLAKSLSKKMKTGQDWNRVLRNGFP